MTAQAPELSSEGGKLPTGRAFTALLALLLGAGIATSYANSMNIPFMLDDAHVIVDNPSVRSLANIPRFFVDPATLTTYHSNADLRPFLQITYALNYAVSQLSPWSYHVLNIGLHFTAAFLVFLIVRDHLWHPAEERGPSGPARLPAAAAALFFALAPLDTQAMNYINGRSALLAGLLCLAAFYSYLERRWVLLPLFYALALLSKASAIAFPAMILAHDFLYRDSTLYPTIGAYVRGASRLLKPVGLPALVALVYLVYRRKFSIVEPSHDADVTPLIWLMSEWPVMLHYVHLFVWPNVIGSDPGVYNRSLFETRAWLPLVLILAWVGSALWVSRRRPIVAFATLWYFVTLAPESTLVPLGELTNEHRAYLPSSLGLAVLVAYGVYAISVWLAGVAGRAFVVVTAVVCLAAIPMTMYRNWQWSDAERYWVDTSAKQPRSAVAAMTAGLALMQKGDLDRARGFYEKAIAIQPDYAYTFVNLSALEGLAGHLEPSIAAAQHAIELWPTLPVAHDYLGYAEDRAGRTQDAVGEFARALALDPNDAEAAGALARMHASAESSEAQESVGRFYLYSLHDAKAAEGHFRRILHKDPDHYGATFQLARALDAQGRKDEARVQWTKFLMAARKLGDQANATVAVAALGLPPDGSAGLTLPPGWSPGLGGPGGR